LTDVHFLRSGMGRESPITKLVYEIMTNWFIFIYNRKYLEVY